MLIATSLMYSVDEWEIEKQKKAMQTWKEIGFDVISCNVKEEMEKLQNLFPQVRFIELIRSGKELTGKPFPFIYDILQTLKNNVTVESELCGIINSDIFLKNVTLAQIHTHFKKRKDTVLIMHRYDIENEFDIKGEYYFSGIDVFFFLSDYINFFPDKGFMLGRPEWDHWFLHEASKAGMQVYEIKNKTAFHIKHNQRWTPMESNNMVSEKAKSGSNVCFDEEHYYKTNIIMSDLSNRVLLGVTSNQQNLVYKQDGFYYDADSEELAEWEMTMYGEVVKEAVGLVYFKNGMPYRICTIHRETVCLPDGKISLGNVVEKPKGCIYKYIDFKDLDFFEKLNRTYVYPAGRASRLLVDCLNTYNVPILGMIDKDSSICGKEYLGKRIFDLTVLDSKEEYDYVLISSNLYIKEIYSELSRIVEKEKLIVI